MKKIFIVFAFIPWLSSVQVSKLFDANDFSLGLNFSPDYCYRTLKSKDALSKSYGEQLDKVEYPKMGYTMGLNIRKPIHRRITIETGINFSSQGGKRIAYDHILTIIPGTGETMLAIKETTTYHNSFMNIPIKADYYLMVERVKLFVSLGIEPNFLFRQKTDWSMEFDDGHKESGTSTNDMGTRAFNLSMIAGIGLSYDIINKLYLIIQPEYRRALLPTSTNYSNLTEYPFSIGLNTSIFYKL